MGKIAKRNEKLHSRIAEILNANTNDIENSPMATIMAEYFENAKEENVFLLLQLKQRFEENN